MNDLTPSPAPRGSRARRRGALLALALAALAAVPAAARPSDEQDTVEAVDNVRAALEEWVDVRRTISKEKRDWAEGKEILEERIEIVRNEIEALRKQIADTEAEIAEADEKQGDLVKQNEELQAATAELAQMVVGIEDRVQGLLKRLPDPINEKVQVLAQLIPEDKQTDKLSLGARFSTIVGILNEVNKAQLKIEMTSEIRELGSGDSAEVTALYIGISQAYYATADGRYAGKGTGTEQGWVWTPANDAAPEIAKAIAILQSEEGAAFVKLPLQVD